MKANNIANFFEHTIEPASFAKILDETAYDYAIMAMECNKSGPDVAERVYHLKCLRDAINE